MVYRKKSRAVTRRYRKMRGGSKFTKFLGKAFRWLRKSKAISNVANALGQSGIPLASQIGNVAGKLGFGRRVVRRRPRRVRLGRGLRLAGN